MFGKEIFEEVFGGFMAWRLRLQREPFCLGKDLDKRSGSCKAVS
jgi:hypothetical protein